MGIAAICFFRLTLFFCLFTIGAGLDSVCAADGNGFVLNSDSDAAWQVTAYDDIVYDLNADQLTVLQGEVANEKENIRLTADTIHINMATQAVVAEGNVRITSNEDIFSGTRLSFQLDRKTGSLYDGTLFLKKNNYHIRADKIEKTGDNTYAAELVHVTTCDGESPDWEIEGKSLDITDGGHGHVKHALLTVRDVPVLYSPFLMFPVNLDRQSGFLSPRFGVSERKGFNPSIPFYWAINDSSDATVYLNYMSRRGLKLGAEYRYFLSDNNNGAVMFDFMEDEEVDDGSDPLNLYGYGDDRFVRPNSDRYWFRMKHDVTLGENAGVMLDLDIVSDQDYLYEFRKGYSGFIDSRNLFRDIFNRGLDDYNDPVRKNRLNFNKQWDGYSLNAEALWWDDVIVRRLAEMDDTVQYLPAIYFDRYKQPLLASRVYAGFETQTVYLHRKDGIRGFRLDLHPRIYLPYRLGNVLGIEPSIGYRQTLWQLSDTDSLDSNTEKFLNRELYDFRLDLSSELYTVYHPDWGDVDGLKHTVKFHTIYDYTPNRDQESYPYFDGLDRIEGENLVTWSIINTFTTRRRVKNAFQYDQVARLELSQNFDIDRERDGDPEPLSPIEAEFRLNIGQYLYLSGDAAWNVYSGDFVSRNIVGRFLNSRGDRLLVQYRFSESLRESVSAAATLNLTDRIRLFSNYERNLRTDREIGKSLGVLFRASCWSFEAEYEKEDNDASFHFVVTLYGLGDLGGDARHVETFPGWAGVGDEYASLVTGH